MQTFDISPVFRTSSAFDRAWDGLSTSIGFDQAGYPAYDLLKTGDNDFRITLAVPGYNLSEISVETHNQRLWIRGEKASDPNHNQYLYQGIGERRFERSFQLPEHVQVTGARLEAGLLHIDLVREIPEELKPRRIEVRTAEEPRALENAA